MTEGARGSGSRLAVGGPILAHSARTAVVAVASLLIAQLFGMREAYWAPITTLVVGQSSLGEALVASWQRFLGTMLGATVGAILASQSTRPVLAFGASVLILGLLRASTRSDLTGYRMGAVTAAIILLVPRTGPPWEIAWHRFAEVAIGIGVALLFAKVWPEREVPLSGKS
jgi:uncharacterized membrane protein YgaE (UPF0421/DUF939 family)